MPTARKPRASAPSAGARSGGSPSRNTRREHEREGVRGESAADAQPRDEQSTEDGTGRHLDVQGHPDPGVRAHQLLRPDERRQGAPSGRREQRVERGRERDEPEQDRERRVEPGDRAEDRGLAEVAGHHQRPLLHPVDDDAGERAEEARDRRGEQAAHRPRSPSPDPSCTRRTSAISAIPSPTCDTVRASEQPAERRRVADRVRRRPRSRVAPRASRGSNSRGRERHRALRGLGSASSSRR